MACILLRGARNGSRRGCGGRATIRRSFNDSDVKSRGCVVALRLAWQWPTMMLRERSCRCDGIVFISATALTPRQSGTKRAISATFQSLKLLSGRRRRCPRTAPHEYLFPSQPTKMCAEPKRPYRWDCGKQLRALAKSAGVRDIRIHDLRHAGAPILMTLRVSDPIVRKITGDRFLELERYQHLTPEVRALTVNLIARELFRAR